MPTYDQAELERGCIMIAKRVEGMCPPGTGYALLLYDPAPGGLTAYVANGARGDVLVALEELTAHIRAEDPAGTPSAAAALAAELRRIITGPTGHDVWSDEHRVAFTMRKLREWLDALEGRRRG